jgi:hypothetical protein
MSSGMVPLEYFLWGHRKDMVYWHKSQKREEFLQQIMESAGCLGGNNEMISMAINSLLCVQN